MRAAPEPVVWKSRQGLSYTSRGEGRPVLLVHGWCIGRQMWTYVEHELVASGHRVIAIDLAGYGESMTRAAHRELSAHAGDVADLLDELDLQGVTAAGFAFGAGVLLSAPPSDRVDAVVSVGTPSAATAAYDRMRRAIVRDWPLFAFRSARAIVTEQTSDETVRWLGDLYRSTPLPSALAGADILERFEPLELTSVPDAALTFVHGADDPIVPASLSEACAEKFGGRCVVIEQAGHLVPVTQPVALAGAVRAAAEQSPA